MSGLSFSAFLPPQDVDYSNITDLAIYAVDGTNMLFSTTRFDGVMSSWTITANGPVLNDVRSFEGGLRAGGTGSLQEITLGGTQTLITGGSTDGGLVAYGLGQTGGFAGTINLTNTAGLFGGLNNTSSFDISLNRQAIYGGLAGNDGIGRLLFDGAGQLVNTRFFADTAQSYAAAISDTEGLTIGANSFLFTASGTENGVSTWQIEPNGVLTLQSSLGVDEGLWVAAPTTLASVQIDGRSYLLLGSAGSNSISVMEVGIDGSLTIRDHLLDTRDTRFGGITALEVVTQNGQVFVVAGGADDGISVLQMLPGGQLALRATIADSANMGLANISDIAVQATGDGLDIFVASSAEAGITYLRYDGRGATLQAAMAGGVLAGGNGDDMLQGMGGDDTLQGGPGADILSDGVGEDVLIGGAGADIFIMAFDGLPDVISDFTVGEDRIDLSGWPMVRDIRQLTMTITATGMRITYGDETLTIQSADGQPIDYRQLGNLDLIGGSRIPQVILPGYPGPYIPDPDLPGRFIAPPQDGSAWGFTGQTIADQFFYNPRIGRVNDATFWGRQWTDVKHLGPQNDRAYGNGGKDTLYGDKGSDRLYGGDWDDRLSGGAGDDNIEGNRGSDKIYGGTGRDKIYGGYGNDKISGNESDDILYGHAGYDKIWGGSGNDRVFGNSNNDSIWGNDGNDMLVGGTGADYISGGNGRDVIYGQQNADRAYGGNNTDKLYGGDGNDRLSGGWDDDMIDGGRHDDKIWGGGGNDKLLGQSGNDTIKGGAGNDGIWGGSGNDVLIGETGDDIIKGGKGNDRIYGGDGRDIILGEAANDTLYGRDGMDTIWGNDGNDTIRGEKDNDVIYGGNGTDIIMGGKGHDQLSGNQMADNINGEDGHDTLWGGDGDDVLNGASGNDTLFGGTGNDRLYGSLDTDQLDGGAGDDLLWGGLGRDQFIFSEGRDSVQDFEQAYDRISLDSDLWDGALQPGDVLFLYGSIIGDTAIIDFQNGNVLTINGVTDYAALGDLIDLF